MDADHLSTLKKRKILPVLQTVEMKVNIHCEGCFHKVSKAARQIKGVKQVKADVNENKLTVVGYMDPGKVLSHVARRTTLKVEIWPYVPYDVVDHPYAPVENPADCAIM